MPVYNSFGLEDPAPRESDNSVRVDLGEHEDELTAEEIAAIVAEANKE